MNRHTLSCFVFALSVHVTIYSLYWQLNKEIPLKAEPVSHSMELVVLPLPEMETPVDESAPLTRWTRKPSEPKIEPMAQPVKPEVGIVAPYPPPKKEENIPLAQSKLMDVVAPVTNLGPSLVVATATAVEPRGTVEKSEVVAGQPSLSVSDQPSDYLEMKAAGYVTVPRIQYPERARRLKLEGLVVIELYVRTDGSVEKVNVIQSSGSSILDEAVVSAHNLARLQPAYKNGKAVPGRVTVPFRFRLERK